MGRKVSSRWRRGNLTIAPLPRLSLHLTLSEDRAKRFIIYDGEILGGDPSAASATDTLFIGPLGGLTTLRLLPTCEPKIRHRPKDDTSPQTRSHGATGGVCKNSPGTWKARTLQGRILRAIVTRGY